MRMGTYRAGGRCRTWIVVALSLYTLVLLGSPILHHDLECHLKRPGHCDACTANPQAPRIETGLGLVAAPLLAAGRVECGHVSSPSAAGFSPTRGRAPPA
jgi:hypothetical protein